jgi:hypothetical protein
VVFDEVCPLQQAGGEVHALPADAKHVAEEFLREVKLVLPIVVGRFQKPAAIALLDCVVLNAGSVLRAALPAAETWLYEGQGDLAQLDRHHKRSVPNPTTGNKSHWVSGSGQAQEGSWRYIEPWGH